MTKTVALVGCGPGGMSFLHAVALRRKRLEKEGNIAALAALPEVTCFERASSPGGVWRSDRSGKEGGKKSTKMYEALWTNGPKECIEFFDYTFDEHFGVALPTYLPRALVLEYVLARCTKDNPFFFNAVKFDTSVKSIQFDKDLGKFAVRTVDNKTNCITEGFFDQCIWAGGNNGKPKIPHDISKVLSSEGYKGTIMHSSETGPSFDQLVRGKGILLIGDSYSAEDLTLQAIKLGVKEVAICSRSGTGIAYYTGSWPMDKVDVYYAHAPTGVTDDGYGILLSDGKENMVLEDVRTVIYCTGYLHNFDMLHSSLRPQVAGPYFTEYKVPSDWKMPPNALTAEFGDMPLGKIVGTPYVLPDIYRGRLMSNPNMMFLLERTESPLADLDLAAWLLLAQTSGDLHLPPLEEMKRFNLEVLLEAMKDPYCRYYYDENYQKRWWSVDDSHWSCNLHDKRMLQMSKNFIDVQYRIMARDMQDAKYPLDIGNYCKLNEKGEALVEFNHVCGVARTALDPEAEDALWRTFRDCDPSTFYSIATDTKAAPLKCRWMDIEGQSKDDMIHTAAKRKRDGVTVTKSKASAFIKRPSMIEIFSILRGTW